MWLRQFSITFLVAIATISQHMKFVNSQSGKQCCKHWTNSGWYELGNEQLKDVLPVCDKERNKTISFRFDRGQTIQINYKSDVMYNTLGISLCLNNNAKDCFVAEIFGKISGQLAFEWRKQSVNEKGNNSWVPGREELLPSTIILEENMSDAYYESPSGRSRIGQGFFEGGTSDEFYVEKTVDDRFNIRLDGGDSLQQNRMSFPVGDEYSWLTVGVKHGGVATVIGSVNCDVRRNFAFEAGQDMQLTLLSRNHSHGEHMQCCTDFGTIVDCYVLKIFGFNEQRQLLYRLTIERANRKDLIQQRLLIDDDYHKTFYQDLSPYRQETVDLRLKKSFNGKLSIEVVGSKPRNYLELDFPVEQRVCNLFHKVELERSSVAYFQFRSRILGPCFDGYPLGYLSSTCKHRIPLNEVESFSEIERSAAREPEGFWSPKPGQTKAIFRSPLLRRSNRIQLCVAVVGIVSQGASISISASSGFETNNVSIHIGRLSYNGFYPLKWQHIRFSKDLPPELHNSSLIVEATSERAAGSVVLLKSVELCPFDGCGLPSTRGTPYIIRGQEISLAKYPWHVGIFTRNNSNSVIYDYICGGTLVRSDIVISAAHCFYDEGKKQIKAYGLFKLSVGKIMNSLYEYEPFQQLSNAFEIHVQDRFRGYGGNFVQDIAIIRVNFTLSSVILPVCIDWSNTSFPLKNGDVGEVAGWGLTENGTYSRKLLYGALPYIPYHQCKAALPYEFVRFITPDKFCAGTIGRVGVGHGDSGGGLVFQTNGLWYLRGIVSTGLSNAVTYSAFTDVSQHITWIKRVLGIREY